MNTAVTPNINFELLDETLAFIEDDPESHDQGTWLAVGGCGTVGCIAGWAVKLSYPDMVHLLTEDEEHEGGVDIVGVGPTTIRQEARALLGLNWEDAAALFAGNNTVGVLRQLRDHMASPGYVPGVTTEQLRFHLLYDNEDYRRPGCQWCYPSEAL